MSISYSISYEELCEELAQEQAAERAAEYEFVDQYGYILGTGSYDIVHHIPSDTYVIGYDAGRLCSGDYPNYNTETFATLEEAKEWFDERWS